MLYIAINGYNALAPLSNFQYFIEKQRRRF